MKKITALFCALGIAFSCVSCSKKSNDDGKGSAGAAAYEGAFKVPQIEKEVIWETDNVRVSAEYFKRTSPGLKLKIENRSSESIELVPYDVYVNDYRITSWMTGSDIPAGETEYRTLRFEQVTFDMGEIDEICSARFRLEARFDGSIETEGSDSIEMDFDEVRKKISVPDGEKLYSFDGVKILSLGVHNIAPTTNTLVLYISNETGGEVHIENGDIRINGRKCENPLLSNRISCDLDDKRRAVCRLDLDKIMNASDIDDLRSLKMSFEIEHENNYESTELLDIRNISGFKKPGSSSAEET